MSKMISRFFASGKGSSNCKKKLEKEVSLVVRDKLNPDGYSLKVSRRLLLEHSGFFREMPEMEFKKLKKIELEDVTVVALQKMVEFMLETKVTFLNHYISLETLKASFKYRIETLNNICTNNLITVLDSSNVCEIYEVASELLLIHLEYSCLKLIDAHADDVLRTRGFVTLKKSTVLDIIKRNSLNVKTELTVFHAVLSWGLNDSLKRNLDPNNIDVFMPVVRHLFNHVRFTAMSDDDLKDPEVVKYLKILSSTELWDKTRSTSVSSSASQSSVSSTEVHPRRFDAFSTYSLNTREGSHHTMKDGETFCLMVEVLKGRVFITSLKLAFGPFAATKNAACLYVVLTATNLSTTEQRTTRGTFLNTTDEAILNFASPISAREPEKIQIALRVKRAENICPFSVSEDVMIAMPESKAVAMKITPVVNNSREADQTGRCVFKEIDYFH